MNLRTILSTRFDEGKDWNEDLDAGIIGADEDDDAEPKPEEPEKDDEEEVFE